MGKIIELKNISKAFDGETVLDGISLDIYDNEFITLLGPSGCGKTTTLRIIGGFVQPDSGDVIFMNERINDTPPHKRNVNTVFQKYALFPHLNVFENIAFPLRERHVPKNETEEKVREMLKMVMLTGFENRRVTSLSGGQQQRVLLARALCAAGRLLILDEPITGLDPAAAQDLYKTLSYLNEKEGMAVVMVTHDLRPALRQARTVLHIGRGGFFYGTAADYLASPQGRRFREVEP